MRSILAIFVLVTFAGLRQAAAQRVFAADKTSWNPAPLKGLSFSRAGFYGFTQQQQLQIRASMAKIMELIHQTPVLNPPKGFCAIVFADLCENNCDSASRRIAGESTIVFLEYFRMGSNSKLEKEPEGLSLHVHFNSLGSLFDTHKDAYFEEPTVARYEQGFPVYGRDVVITKRKGPLFVPLSRERYLQIEIARARKIAEDVRSKAKEGSPYQQWLKNKDGAIKSANDVFEILAKTDPVKAKVTREKMLAGIRQSDSMYKADEAKFLQDQQKMIDKFDGNVTKLQQELAGLSPEEKKAPVTGYGGRSYVQVNSDLFDRSLPPTALQLLVIDLYKNSTNRTTAGTNESILLFKEIIKTLDLVKLQSALQ